MPKLRKTKRPSATPQNLPSARRRLAPNVVCMFPDDREPIIQPRRRGRYPRGVASIKDVERLRVGVVAEVVNAGPKSQENVGARVLITKFDRGELFDCECKGLDRDLHWWNSDTHTAGKGGLVWCKGVDLRRLWTGGKRVRDQA